MAFAKVTNKYKGNYYTTKKQKLVKVKRGSQSARSSKVSLLEKVPF